MFFIFTYAMSRVTHSEPGLPMIHRTVYLLLWSSFPVSLPFFFLLPQIPETVQLSTEKNRQNTELISWPSIERVKLQYRMCQCLRCEFRRSTTGGLQIPLSTELSR